MVYDCVSKDAADCGMPVERSDILRALTEGIESGLAQAYRLAVDAEPLQEMPSLEEMETPHTIDYYLTPKGMELHLAYNDLWPFVEQGILKDGWTLPTE